MAISSLLIIIAVLVALLALGVPITYAIGCSALAAILQIIPLETSVFTAAQRTFVGMSIFSLTAIPFFIMAGNLMNQGGIAKRLVYFVLAIIGKVPGSLMVANVGANALFGAISGSAAAAAAAVGSMVKEGQDDLKYDPALCTATNGAFDTPFQRPYYLFPGVRGYFRGGPFPGWLSAGAYLGPGLHCSSGHRGQEEGLQGAGRGI